MGVERRRNGEGEVGERQRLGNGGFGCGCGCGANVVGGPAWLLRRGWMGEIYPSRFWPSGGDCFKGTYGRYMGSS